MLLKAKHTLFFCLALALLMGACGKQLPVFYTKARSSEEIKQSAFKRCGANYHIQSYEDDTAKIECLEQRN